MFHYNQKLTNKNNYKIDSNDKNNRVSSNTVHKVRCSRNILQSVIKVKLLEQLHTLSTKLSVCTAVICTVLFVEIVDFSGE